MIEEPGGTPTGRWEVIVVGAGPAGAATASHLARAGRSVLLVDRAAFPRDKPCAEYASPETEQVLRRLGAWAMVERAGVRRLRGMVIVAPSGRRFPSEYLDGGVRRHSLALSRLVLDALLVKQAQQAGVELRTGLRVETALLANGCVIGVRARGPDRMRIDLHASLVVGADGLRSRLARELGGAHRAPWPRRLGLATHYRNLDGPADWGEMFVGRRGYCGLAPLDGGLTTVAAGARLEGRAGRTAAARLDEMIAEHPELRQRIARAERAKPVRGVGPLAWRVPHAAGPGFLLVGDAAGFFDPFTGEGIYRALRGAELAAEAGLTGLGSQDWGAMARGYAQLRCEAFAAKERLAWLIQLFVACPPLLEYALVRLARRPELATRLSAALGDYGPASVPLHPAYLGRLLRP